MLQRIYPHTIINPHGTYVVMGVAKDDRSEREAFQGSYWQCDDYAQRNESPDNWETYYVAEVPEVID